MKQSLLLFAFVLFTSVFSFSQENQPLQLVYLTDGSFLKGVMLENSNEKTVSIQLTDGSVIELSKDLVWSVRKVKAEEILLPEGRRLLKKGMYSSISFHTLTAHRSSEFDNDLRWGLGAHFSAGFQFSPVLRIGGGIGIDAHEYFLAPVFMEFSGFFVNEKIRGALKPGGNAGIKRKFPLCYTLQAGFNIPLAELFNGGDNFEQIKGGWMIYPALGFMFPSRSGTTFRLDAGYKFQRYTRVYETQWWNDWVTKDKVLLKSFAARVSWVF